MAPFGVGLRPQHYQWILEHAPAVDWFEVISENYMGVGGKPRRFLERVRERYPVALHGVGLGIGNAAPPTALYLKRLKELADRIEPRFVSDHLCWTAHEGRNSHDLLPLAYTEESLRHLVERVDLVQTALGRRFYLENPSAYVAFAASAMDEATFLAELCRRTGCGLLLDVNNLFVNACNLGVDPLAYLARLDPASIAYMHLAGHSVMPEVRVDTHDEPVPPGVWELYRQAVALFPEPGTLIEWDAKLPDAPRLLEEMEEARRQHAVALAGERVAATVSAPPAPSEATLSWPELQDRFFSLATACASVPADAPDLSLFRSDVPAPRLVGVNVYADAYHLRLCEVIRDTYPALTNVLGEAAFDRLLLDYLAAHPSTEVSVKYVARGLAAHLATLDLSADYAVPSRLLADVAALEWAQEDLFDAPDGPAPLPVATLGEVGETEWERARFAFVPAVRLVETAFDVAPVLAAVAEGVPPERPEEEACCYLVYRAGPDDGFDVAHVAVDPALAPALAGLIAGRTFGEACTGLGDDEVAQTAGWLVRCFELGLVHGLSVS